MAGESAGAGAGADVNGAVDVVLDVDTGVDDALALLLAARSPNLRLRAVTCVEGNVDVDRAVANTRAVLHAAGPAGAAVPVARGCERPRVGPPSGGRSEHGRDGLADLGLAAPPGGPVPGHAVDLLRAALLAASAPVTVIGLAPLTNLALLLERFPQVAGRIARLVLVAGAPAGSAPDFNLAHDPEAAPVVLGSGVPVTLYGVELFPLVTVPMAEVEALAAGAPPAARLAGQLLAHQERRTGDGRARLGDAAAVAAVADPAALDIRRRPVGIGLAGPARGRLVPDLSGVAVDVGAAVDGPRLVREFLDRLRPPGRPMNGG